MGISITDAFEDKELLGFAVQNQDTFANWKIFMKALEGLEMTAEELTQFQSFTERKEQPRGGYRSVFVASGRKSGKSWISSNLCCHTVLLGEDFWSAQLAPGEKVYFSIISVDKESARQVLNYIKGILNNNPKFRARITNQTSWEIELGNVVIQIRAASWTSGRAPRYIGVILDEAAFMRDSDSSYNAESLYKSLQPAMIPGSAMYVISSVHGKFGLLYNQWRRWWGKEDPGHLFWLSDTLAMNPTYDKSYIDDLMAEDPVHAQSEYYSVWKEKQIQFLPGEAVDAAVAQSRYQLARIPDKEYAAFVDSSSGMQDSFGLCIGFRDEDKIVIARLEERENQAPQDVIKEFSEIMKGYGISTVSGDRYSIGFVIKEFEQNGISYEPAKLPKSEIYLNAGPQILQNKVELLDNRKAANQLKQLERHARAQKDYVDHPRGKYHDDLANVIMGVVFLLTSEENVGPAFTYSVGRGIRESKKEDYTDESWVLGSSGGGGRQPGDTRLATGSKRTGYAYFPEDKK